MAATESKTFYPGAYDQSDYSYSSISGATNPVGKGSSNGTYATIGCKTGASGITSVYWPFDLSAIPEEATIDSVLCEVLVYFDNTSITSSHITTRSIQLYSGQTAKGSGADIPVGDGTGVVRLTAGTWTRDELKLCRLRLYAKRGTSNTYVTYNIRFYGADLTVTYTYQGEKFMLKLETGSDVELPDGYTRTDYIESTGAQYINTGFIPTSATRVVCDFQFTATSTIFWTVFGSRGAASAYEGRFCFHLTNASVFRSDYNNANLTFSSSLGATDRHTVDKNQNTCTVDSTSVTHSAGSFAGVYPMYLFALNTAGATECEANLRIYSCQIYDNGTLVRDFLPCIDPDGVAGMYDVKNGVFYPSETATPFVNGPVYTGDWHDIARVFKKVNGIWVEQTDLANVIEDGVRYQNGGEYVKPATFVVDGVEYTMEEGMTWAEWIASDYNTAGFYLSSNYVYSSNGKRVQYYPYGTAGDTNIALATLVISNGNGGNYFTE